MKNLIGKALLPAVAGLAFSLTCAAAGRAGSELKTIRNSDGGMIVYGQVDGASSEAAAMGSVLRSIHAECGEKPQVGKVFAVRGTRSAAVFFTVVNRAQGNVPVAGLLIASPGASGHMEAALVTDAAARFGTAVDPMLKTLFGLWHPGGTSAHSSGAASSAKAQLPKMERVSTSDGSASVSLPKGWAMNPVSRWGTIIAHGPHAEGAILGSALLAMDTNNPRVLQTEAFAQGAGRNTVYARTMYYPHGGDLGTTFVAVFQRSRENVGNQPADMTVAHVADLNAAPPSRCARITGTLDVKDGTGLQEFDAIFCSGGVSPMGQFMNLYDIVAIPKQFAASESTAAAAILSSFSVDENVTGAQAHQMAAPEIARINAEGRRAAQQAASAHAMEDEQNAAVERHWDSMDRNGQAFSNYLLDQSVIEDTKNDTHATVWSSTADGLVRSNPDRYQYVDTPNFWKGVDY